MTTAPRVSVVIPVFNRERYIATAIESILAQRFANLELILIDDGSTDDSRAVMASYSDPRVRLVTSERNRGIPATRNLGLALARGEYIAWLDSDDYAFPDRLHKQVAFLERNRDVALVGSWRRAIDADGRDLGQVRRWPCAPEEIRARLLFRCYVSQYSATGRAGVFRRFGYRDDYPVCEDFDLFVRMAETHRLANLPYVLVCRRLHAAGITQQETGRVKETNKAIVARQLRALEMSFTDGDLDNHFVLTRMAKLRFRPDAAYVDWTEAWLQALAEANARTGRYAQPEFRRVLGWAWLRVCSRAARGRGGAVWRRFGRSSLGRPALANLGRTVALQFLGRPLRSMNVNP